MTLRQDGVLGGFNWSSTPFTHGGVYGPTCWLDSEFDWASGDAIAWRAISQARIGAVVQAADRPPGLRVRERPNLLVCRSRYLWSYRTGQFEESRIVAYDFAESRAGKHAMEHLGDWRGALVCDDYSGYKALLAKGLLEVGCMAHVSPTAVMEPATCG